MKNTDKRLYSERWTTVVSVFAIFCVLLLWLGVYNFEYMEHLTTMYYNGERSIRVFAQPGGFCDLVADFLLQFFIHPYVGVLITAALFTAITCLMARILESLSKSMACVPLLLLPTFALAYLTYNVNYIYSGNVAFLVMLIPLSYIVKPNGTLRFQTPANRVLFIGVFTVLLYSIAGAVSMLFGIMAFVIKAFINPRRCVWYLCSPLIALLMGWTSVHQGVICDLAHAITPVAYFTARLNASSLVYAPWVLMVLVIVLAGIFTKLTKRNILVSRRSKMAIFYLLLTVSIVAGAIGGKTYVNPQNEMYKRLNCYIRQGQWEKVTDTTSKIPMDNLLLQNCRNLALAEQGLLADSLFSAPCYDIRSIYNNEQSSPYIYMLLSDIYYSMGHIALSQRYAFEALEMLDNMSPRMLQRLVMTNTIFGNYLVAEKYLKRLDKTLYYKGWAKDMRSKLNDEAVMADPELAIKRSCIFPIDRFAAFDGLDIDLLDILRYNPDHKITMQYLGSLYLLTKDLHRFRSTIDEFYGTEALPKLPRDFAEAMVINANDSIITRYAIPADVVTRYQNFVEHPSSKDKNVWQFLMYVN